MKYKRDKFKYRPEKKRRKLKKDKPIDIADCLEGYLTDILYELLVDAVEKSTTGGRTDE